MNITFIEETMAKSLEELFAEDESILLKRARAIDTEKKYELAERDIAWSDEDLDRQLKIVLVNLKNYNEVH